MAHMSDSMFVQFLGAPLTLTGIAGILVSANTGATLFIPFAAVLALTGAMIQVYGWQLRGLPPLPRTVRPAVVHAEGVEDQMRATLDDRTYLPPPSRWLMVFLRGPKGP